MENHEFWGETFPPIQIVAEDKDFLAIIITKFKKCIILLRDYADPDQPVFGAGSNLTRA
jgi:hypothetical protein